MSCGIGMVIMYLESQMPKNVCLKYLYLQPGVTHSPNSSYFVVYEIIDSTEVER